MSSATFARGRGQVSDIIVKPVLVQLSINADSAPMEHSDFSVILVSCYFHTDFVRGFATFDTLLNYILLVQIILGKTLT